MKPKPQQRQEEEAEVIRFVVRPRKDVNFAVGTIDNEGMDKKKSKSKSFKLTNLIV